MRLHPVGGGDPQQVRDALPAALEGIRPIALGFEPGLDDAVPEGTAVVIATSGSTGVPKRVVLSADALRASAAATAARIGSGQWMLALPAGYVAGLQVLVRAQLAGTSPVVLDGRFSVTAFADATEAMDSGIRRYSSLVPAQLTTLLDAADDPRVVQALRAYEAILVGGQRLEHHKLEKATSLGARIVRTYGSSETSGGCVYDGVPLDGVRAEVLDGEIRLAGAMLATGYLGEPARTERAFALDGDGVRWYRTGDAGTVTDGTLEVRGRIDNVIVSGGINVSLDRVERIVRTVPGLEEAIVLAIPDERWGEASAIFVAAGPGDPPQMLEDARNRVAAEVGRHARPLQIQVDAQVPLLPSGKPDREMIRRMILD